MDLNDFMDTGKKKVMFKASVKNGAKALKIFVSAYGKKEAELEAQKTIEKEHPDMDPKKISVEELGKCTIQ